MGEVTYYFNAYGGTSEWTDPDKIVDNLLDTFGNTNTKNAIQDLTSNTCPGSDLGTISKVEIRGYGYGDGDDRIILTPLGNDHYWVPGTNPGWGIYYDITLDGGAPSPWQWSDVQGLDVRLMYGAVGKGNQVNCAKVEIRVTYTPAGGVTVSPNPISFIAKRVNPTAILGSLSLTLNPVSMLKSRVNPVIILGSISIAPTPASAIKSSVNPSVILGSIVLAPSAVSFIGGKANPVVVLGSTSVIPASLYFLLTGVDPTVIAGAGGAITKKRVFAMNRRRMSFYPTLKLG